MSKFKYVVAGVAVATAMFASTAHAYTRNSVLDATASWLAMRPVQVHCDNIAEAAVDDILQIAYAYVEFLGNKPENFMTVRPEICQPLLDWENGHTRIATEKDLALSIMVLTHESAHLRGEMDEARAQCWAIRHVRYVAEHLGFGHAEARWIRDIALREDAAHNRAFPQYDLPGCHRPVSGSA